MIPDDRNYHIIGKFVFTLWPDCMRDLADTQGEVAR